VKQAGLPGIWVKPWENIGQIPEGRIENFGLIANKRNKISGIEKGMSYSIAEV
jgi:hypothetical protein